MDRSRLGVGAQPLGETGVDSPMCRCQSSTMRCVKVLVKLSLLIHSNAL